MFAKQIVDLLYQIKILDIVMVLFACGLIVYKVVKDKLFCDVKNNILKKINITDYGVFALAVLYGLAFLKDTSALSDIVKIESAFLVYILGRFYYDSIKCNGKKMAVAGYIIIYSNFIYSVAHQIYHNITGDFFPWEPFQIENGGALYYYKTDLALGIVVATVFIYAFSELKIIKWITIFFPTVLTLIGTKARMGQVMLVFVFALIGVNEIKKYLLKKNVENTSVKKKQFLINLIFGLVFGVLILFFIGVQFSPIKSTDYYGTGVSTELDDKIENIFHSRHVIYWDTVHYISNENVFYQFFGNDLNSFPFHNQRGMMSHSLYVNGLYVVGYIGLMLIIFIPYRTILALCYVKDREINFVIFMMTACFMLFGLTTDSLITTQLSWFPFIFFGVANSIMHSEIKEGK